MTRPVAKDPLEILQKGAGILSPALVPHGFHFAVVGSGKGSGGPFAHGEFVRHDRRLELHFRYSLGLVTYHVGGLALLHDDYLRALLGRSRAGRYPSVSEDALAAFDAVRLDLIEHCADFLSGSGEQFRQCVERHKCYESLSPFQKMDFGAA